MSELATSEAAGETKDMVVVRRQVSQPLKDVWKVLMTDDGAEALLGPGGRLGGKGHRWQAQDGTHGVTRSFHPLQQIRFSWHKNEDAPATLVDLHVREKDSDSTELEIVHDHLDETADVDWLVSHWESALDRITEAA